MKKLLLISILALGFASAMAQNNAETVIAATGHLPYTLRQTTTVNHNGIVVLAGFDTLTAPDSGYVQFSMPNKYSKVVTLSVKSLTGTLAGTAVVQGSPYTQVPIPTSLSWLAMTGNTTYFAGGKGASATLSGSGTTTYEWHFPYDSDDEQNYQVRVILTGTCTATYTATVGYKK